ncbi:PEP/pyruvate-binding domain-containing protein [Streptomyces corynorhini]|uniref:Phosphoenolpyruvate synthase n=1 Tax=Streptomyces corynorhini TaxID=2282652 RepID=A0A370B858_9ACTN|nr:PEP/pyruvate-binding domain-containing protein [Streptomyces corynorhini]RDG35595.1 phosphoenolpyruvate synthase [Streptomyces corynorhini]
MVNSIIEQRNLLDERSVGGKFSRQARMVEQGFSVPKFFCISPDVHRRLLDTIRPDVEKILEQLDPTSPEQLSTAAEELRRLVHEAPVPPGVTESLYAAFDKHFPGGGLVSVRSCIVRRDGLPGEDSEQDAFAGVSDSFLYVDRARLLDRVRDCWSSGLGTQALLYILNRGMSPDEFAVSVGVQRMVPGTRSFVLFTCDPRTGARDRVLAAGLGIGEGVVQEKVPVDHYFVDRAGGRISARVVRKDSAVRNDPGRPESGLDILPVPADQQLLPALTDEQVRHIVGLGDRIERLFGSPQDIEGTVTDDGTVHILQSRPVVLERESQRLWSNANITESFPGVTTALTYSFAQRFYRADFRDFYRRLGVPAKVLDRHEADLNGMIGLLNGRVYYAIDSWYRLHRMSRLFPVWRGSWERMMGLSPSIADSRQDRLPRRAVSVADVTAFAARIAGQRVSHDRAARRFLRWWNTTIEEHRAAADDADALRLARLVPSLWREVGDHWGVTLVNDFFLQTTADIITALFERWLPDADPGLRAGLLCGGHENRSVTIMMSVVGLAEETRTRPDLMAALESKPADEVWQGIVRGDHGPEIARRFQDHLRHHGDRGLQELKLEVPAPRQDPAQLLRAVADYARATLTRAELRAREITARRDAERELGRLLVAHPARRRVLRTLLDQQRRYTAFREDSRYCRSELFGFAKDVFRRLGEDLASRGVIDRAQDVVHLTHDEVLGYFDGTAVTDDLRSLVRLREAEFDARPSELPMDFATMGPVRDALPDTGQVHLDDEVLTGLGSSGGIVQGTARIVLDPHEPLERSDDMILVARETDPGWMFLMLAARGIVVERGTMLSHTAITGRKFGIPTVVSVPHATKRITDGARIELDGAKGTVRLLDGPE